MYVLFVCNQNTETISVFKKGWKNFENLTRFGGEAPVCLDIVLDSSNHKTIVVGTIPNRIWEAPSTLISILHKPRA
jgi:hypothetical protein